ncbi:MAG: YicC/YloC family endoribonuclease [Thermodesulfobacteriota bacterium]|nr:MAG: YicC/YloC family endoribonuclease [Thermodesulfobacteriota bacterium]
MARSMTGWGKGDFNIGGDLYAIEVKALNHRFIDISMRAPERFSPFETKIRDEIKKRFARGSFSVHIIPVSAEAPPLRLNLQMAKLYLDAAAELKSAYDVRGEMDLASLLRQKDIFTFERRGSITDEDWEPLRAGLESALNQVEAWRAREGEALRTDLLSRADSLEGLLFTIEARIPKMLESYRERLKAEMEKVLAERIEESRILLEAAIFAEKTDTAEEATRLKSHIEMFRKLAASDGPIGKKLDFLCQELGREINTIGSKANDVKITQTVIDMKSEVEKIREQVQNVE